MPSLQNKILAITRGEEDAQEFSQLVSVEGGRVIGLPTIEVVPRSRQAAQEFLNMLRKKKHDYCAFMSANAVDVLFQLAEADQVIVVLNSTTVIAAGPKTKQELAGHGVDVQLVPEKYSSEGLVELLSKMGPAGKKIIIPRSGASNEFAFSALSDLGMAVDEIFLYTVRTCAPTPAWNEFSQLLEQKKIDAVIFTSASSVRSFFEILDKASPRQSRLESTKVISIGPLTSRELKERKIKYLEADEHTVKGTFELAKRAL